MMLEKRSVTLAGHRTSVALEPEFWSVLEAVAAREGMSLAGLMALVDAGRGPERPLASALRVFALQPDPVRLVQAGAPISQPSPRFEREG